MTLPFQLTWVKLLTKGLPVLVALGFVLAVFLIGSRYGASRVQAKWDKVEQGYTKQVARLTKEKSERERGHRAEVGKITHALAQSQAAYAADISAINAGWAKRLSDSDRRAASYLAMSQGGPAQSTDLANHAAQLDGSLEQGRRLVGELRSTLEQRDQQIRALSQQILADRSLIGEINESDGNSTGR